MESISRISSVLETARDLTLEAAQSASALRGVPSASGPINRNMSATQIRKLLDSRNERDVLEGLRKVISLMYHPSSSPTPTVPFFPSVIKNIATPSLPLKKLIYIYLLHHAETEPDLALLSINTIQKSLSDANPQVRALALRTMSGIRVPVISQIVSLAIKKGCGDMSPLVRRAAALAVPKCYALDPEGTLPQLLDCLSLLLGDRQYYVVGAAVAAFWEVCPERIDLIHKHYRSLVRKIVDMDEWGQLATLRLMLRYGRRCFPRRTRRVAKSGQQGFYGDEDGGDEAEKEQTTEVQVLDPDLEAFLKACKPLLQSRNSAVVVAVARCYLYLGTPSYLDLAVGPLVSLLRGPQDIQQIALYNIVCVCLSRPTQFAPHYARFLVHTTDPPAMWALKLEILTIIFPHCSPTVKSVILHELEHFSRGRAASADLVRESVRSIGRCAQASDDPRTAQRCLRLLLDHVSSPDGTLVAESLTVVRHLIQQNPTAHTKTVIRLAKNLDTATNAEARATIIWLVGEFAGVSGENNIAPDVLRLLARDFAAEPEAAKLQIVLLAAKVYVHHLNRTQPLDQNEKKDTTTQSVESIVLPGEETDGGFAEPEPRKSSHDGQGAPDPMTTTTISEEPEHPIAMLWKYILLLARYDTSYDLRDRARMYKSLLAVPSSTQLANLLLLAPKPVPHAPSPSESRKAFTLGSGSLVIGDAAGLHGMRGYEPVPEWVKDGEQPDPSVRDEETTQQVEYTTKKEVPAGQKLDNAVRAGGAKPATTSTATGQDRSGARPNGWSAATGKEKTLDDWLAESDEEEEDDDDDTEESTEEESSEEEGEESSEDNDEREALVTQPS
ncbi:MAG: AP-3 complex subunit beta [Piccolia ochrophora]|nr:MAG: AP-3 complex subunit beta [Piccolia ochrophora]